jgi:hypothetical protein
VLSRRSRGCSRSKVVQGRRATRLARFHPACRTLCVQDQSKFGNARQLAQAEKGNSNIIACPVRLAVTQCVRDRCYLTVSIDGRTLNLTLSYPTSRHVLGTPKAPGHQQLDFSSTRVTGSFRKRAGHRHSQMPCAVLCALILRQDCGMQFWRGVEGSLAKKIYRRCQI